MKKSDYIISFYKSGSISAEANNIRLMDVTPDYALGYADCLKSFTKGEQVYCQKI